MVSRICRSETIPDLLRENPINSNRALFAEGGFPWPPLLFFITPYGVDRPGVGPLLVHQPLDPVGADRDPYGRRTIGQAVDHGVGEDRLQVAEGDLPGHHSAFPEEGYEGLHDGVLGGVDPRLGLLVLPDVALHRVPGDAEGIGYLPFRQPFVVQVDYRRLVHISDHLWKWT